MNNFTIKSIRSHFHKTVTSKAPCPCKHRFASLPLQSTLQLLVVNITFHSLRLSYLAGPRLRGLVNHSHSFSLKIGNETIFFLGAPFGRGPLVFELRCPKLRYATEQDVQLYKGARTILFSRSSAFSLLDFSEIVCGISVRGGGAPQLSKNYQK